MLYLAGHALTGRQGLVSYVQLQEKQRVLQREAESLSTSAAAFEARAARLRPNDLDLDYLEERARLTFRGAVAGELLLLPVENASQP